MSSTIPTPKDVGSLMEGDAIISSESAPLTETHSQASTSNDVTDCLAELSGTEAMQFAVVVYAAQTDGFGKQFLAADGSSYYANNSAFDDAFPERMLGNQECALFTNKADLRERLPEIAAKLLDSGNTEHKATGRRVFKLLNAEEQKAVQGLRQDAIEVLRACDANGMKMAA